MQGFLLRWLFNAIAIYLTTRIIQGVQLPDFTAAILAALILGIVNAFIRPVVLLFTLPINLLTLGLFTLIVNTFMLYIVAAVVPSFMITGFVSAVVGALLIAIISTLLSHIFAR